jgi:hypothetical protein
VCRGLTRCSALCRNLLRVFHEFFCSEVCVANLCNAPYGVQCVTNITNKHFIHADLEWGLEFLSIYHLRTCRGFNWIANDVGEVCKSYLVGFSCSSSSIDHIYVLQIYTAFENVWWNTNIYYIENQIFPSLI